MWRAGAGGEGAGARAGMRRQAARRGLSLSLPSPSAAERALASTTTGALSGQQRFFAARNKIDHAPQCVRPCHALVVARAPRGRAVGGACSPARARESVPPAAGPPAPADEALSTRVAASSTCTRTRKNHQGLASIGPRCGSLRPFWAVWVARGGAAGGIDRPAVSARGAGRAAEDDKTSARPPSPYRLHKRIVPNHVEPLPPLGHSHHPTTNQPGLLPPVPSRARLFNHSRGAPSKRR